MLAMLVLVRRLISFFSIFVLFGAVLGFAVLAHIEPGPPVLLLGHLWDLRL